MVGIFEYSSFLMNWTSVLVVTLVSIYLYSTRNFKYWKRRGVRGPKPLPFVGNIFEMFKKPQCLQLLDDYKNFGKIHGIYDGQKPILIVGEPELIKDITTKDFHSFVDRMDIPFGHPMFDRSLLNIRGEQWKQTRVIVSPTFSSGKMRRMHVLIEECVQRLDKALEKIANSDSNDIEVRKVMQNYTMDVISICAFATKIDTYNTSAEEHPFIKNANAFFQPSLRFGLFFLMNAIYPPLVRNLNFSFCPKYIINYFESILKSIIFERESQKGPKNIDFLQLLIDAKTKQMDNKDIDEDIKLEVQRISESMKKRGFQLEEIDILATSLLFILAGNETTSSTLGYLFHELALNTECQQKLYEEIKSFGDRIDYDTISQMPYLESCVSETLRMYPPIVLNQRMATEDYELGDTGLQIPKGMDIRVPVYAIHHDPSYFPNPDQFIPERFMPENSYRINPYTFLPFGKGPRNCVGMRFALMNIKTAVVNILAKYRFIRTQNTKTEFEYKKFVVLTQAIDMGTVRIEIRK